MKIGHYSQAITNFPSNLRACIFLNDSLDLAVDIQLLWAYYLEQQGERRSLEKIQFEVPSLLSKIIEQKINPLLFLKQTEELYHSLKTSLASNTSSPLYPIKKIQQKDNHQAICLDKIQTYRDFYVHEKHVKKGFEKRQESIPEAWFELPVYYKGATAGFIGANEPILWPSFTQKLDYELELAIIIAKDGKNITEKNAASHILGLTILNDISARDIQKKEMSVRLGPSKAKDFCSIIGPVIVTIDEFDFTNLNLKMTATINGEVWSEGYSGDARYSFAEMLAFASRDEWILRNDLIGSGTVGTGCGLEIDRWLSPGDKIDLTIEKIGTLSNTVATPLPFKELSFRK